jgi:hypothetical protein
MSKSAIGLPAANLINRGALVEHFCSPVNLSEAKERS